MRRKRAPERFTASTRLLRSEQRLLQAVAAEKGETICDLLRDAAKQIIAERFGSAAIPDDSAWDPWEETA